MAALKENCWYATAGRHRERSMLVRRPEKTLDRSLRERKKKAVCASVVRRSTKRDVTIGLLSDGSTARRRHSLVASHRSNSPSIKLTACSVSVRLSASMALPSQYNVERQHGKERPTSCLMRRDRKGRSQRESAREKENVTIDQRRASSTPAITIGGTP